MAQEIFVFAGPSVHAEELDQYPNLVFLPPCKQGDVFLVSQEQPKAIGIIDGYFDGVPSVWHKEILWAMKEGIAVLGSSSMGALRAAELDQFGMNGIGSVYEMYRDGHIEDDDEVALQHGPEEVDYMPLSLPMVNVRATAVKACEEKILLGSEVDVFISSAKSIFYKDRNWDAIVDAFFDSLSSPTVTKNELREWIETNEVDQKKLDALLLLEKLNSGSFDAPDSTLFEFEITRFWQGNVKLWQERALLNDTAQSDNDDRGYRLFS